MDREQKKFEREQKKIDARIALDILKAEQQSMRKKNPIDVQSFEQPNNVVIRKHRGNLNLSEEMTQRKIAEKELKKIEREQKRIANAEIKQLNKIQKKQQKKMNKQKMMLLSKSKMQLEIKKQLMNFQQIMLINN